MTSNAPLSMKQLTILFGITLMLLQTNSYSQDKTTPDGESLTYYDNGQLESKEFFKDGKREGEWVR